jgi:hypothetical protein
MLGQPKANSARAARERRSKGESERAAMATGPAGGREGGGWLGQRAKSKDMREMNKGFPFFFYEINL